MGASKPLPIVRSGRREQQPLGLAAREGEAIPVDAPRRPGWQIILTTAKFAPLSILDSPGHVRWSSHPAAGVLRQEPCAPHGMVLRRSSNAPHCTVPHPMCAACAPGADASRPCRQVYHSNLEDPNAEVVCGCAILPMKTTTKGPAPVIQDGAHTLHPHSHVRDS